MPLDEYAPVDTTTVIENVQRSPLKLENPVYISHMSFGALSRKLNISRRKAALPRERQVLREGGILSVEMAAADKYILNM